MGVPARIFTRLRWFFRRAEHRPELSPAERTALRERGQALLQEMLGPSAEFRAGPFNTGNAMGRNKIVYALADWALIIASDLGRGGTWAGAVEALEKKWVPIFVLDDPTLEGNQQLIAAGGIAFPSPFSRDPAAIRVWLASPQTDEYTVSF